MPNVDARLCRQCAQEMIPGHRPLDLLDFSGVVTLEDVTAGVFAKVFCSGCGETTVDHEGRCTARSCSKKTSPSHRQVFVFGSNLAGYHGAGAAAFAVIHHGAIMRVGYGVQGNAYAIPTKDVDLTTLPLTTVRKYVTIFKRHARINKALSFHVTKIGCGLAGFSEDDIAPLFIGAPSNCDLPDGWTR